jgi:hypothetical protein
MKSTTRCRRSPSGNGGDSGCWNDVRRNGRVWDAIGNLLDLFKPEECRNYFNAAGYMIHHDRRML